MARYSLVNEPADTDTAPNPAPNGPAHIVTDAKKDRFKIEYAGEPIFQASVRIVRDGNELALKAAAVRLFVVSKFDGWDVVTQSIRVAAIGATPGDTLALCGHSTLRAPDVTVAALDDGSTGLYREAQDWLLSVDAGPDVECAPEELSAAASADGRAPRILLDVCGADVTLKFRPHYRARHGGA
jgi:hypothetical protein